MLKQRNSMSHPNLKTSGHPRVQPRPFPSTKLISRRFIWYQTYILDQLRPLPTLPELPDLRFHQKCTPKALCYLKGLWLTNLAKYNTATMLQTLIKGVLSHTRIIEKWIKLANTGEFHPPYWLVASWYPNYSLDLPKPLPTLTKMAYLEFRSALHNKPCQNSAKHNIFPSWFLKHPSDSK